MILYFIWVENIESWRIEFVISLQLSFQVRTLATWNDQILNRTSVSTQPDLFWEIFDSEQLQFGVIWRLPFRWHTNECRQSTSDHFTYIEIIRSREQEIQNYEETNFSFQFNVNKLQNFCVCTFSLTPPFNDIEIVLKAKFANSKVVTTIKLFKN